ncbi:MAG: hypothetical protein WC307_06725 [Candidatus Nanoarchaeia archaeon]|jgi:hypothetical protein
MGDSIVIQNSTGTVSVTVKGIEVEYFNDQSWLVKLNEPNLTTSEIITRLLKSNDINRTISITGSLVGPTSTDDMLKLMDLMTEKTSCKVTVRALTFNDCNIKSVSAVDRMSVTGTKVNTTSVEDPNIVGRYSQNFSSTQVLSDMITYHLKIKIERGLPLGE